MSSSSKRESKAQLDKFIWLSLGEFEGFIPGVVSSFPNRESKAQLDRLIWLSLGGFEVLYPNVSR